MLLCYSCVEFIGCRPRYIRHKTIKRVWIPNFLKDLARVEEAESCSILNETYLEGDVGL